MTNLLIHASATTGLREHVPDGSATLAYLDPPWRTGRNFSQYADDLPREDWAVMMRDVLQEVHRTLSDDGSIWLHLNAQVLPHGRQLLDDTFGAKNFLGQVAWERKKNGSYLHRHFSDSLDHILVYAKDRTLTPRFTIPGSQGVSRAPLLQPGTQSGR